jgi:hypothetical protein
MDSCSKVKGLIELYIKDEKKYSIRGEMITTPLFLIEIKPYFEGIDLVDYWN